MDQPTNEQGRANLEPIKSPLKAIRAFCRQCVGGSARAIEACADEGCDLFWFRFGKNPFRKPMSQEQREKLRRLAKERGLGVRTNLRKGRSDAS